MSVGNLTPRVESRQTHRLEFNSVNPVPAVGMSAIRMRISLQLDLRQYDVDLDLGRSIAIPLRFDDDQPNLFDVPLASAQEVAIGEFVGSTKRGGDCNVMKWSIIPHCHGTHTESVSHIINDEVPVSDCAGGGLGVAILVTVKPIALGNAVGEAYACGKPEDLVISVDHVRAAMAAIASSGAVAIVIRTEPNNLEKQTAKYAREPIPPYFTSEAMGMIADSGIRHLLVDVPSIDRIFDGGVLANHHRFWNITLGSKQLGPPVRMTVPLPNLFTCLTLWQMASTFSIYKFLMWASTRLLHAPCCGPCEKRQRYERVAV